jgi:hypothetical protein
MSEISTYSPIGIRDPSDTLIAFGYQQVRFLGSVTVVELAGQTQITIGGGASIAVQDEGLPIVSTGTINFVGAGVTVTNNAGVAEVNIPGGGAVTGTPDRFAFFNALGNLSDTNDLKYDDVNKSLSLGTSITIVKSGTNFTSVVGSNLNVNVGSTTGMDVKGSSTVLNVIGSMDGTSFVGNNSNIYLNDFNNCLIFSQFSTIGAVTDTFRRNFNFSFGCGNISINNNLATAIRETTSLGILGRIFLDNFDGDITGLFVLGDNTVSNATVGSFIGGTVMLGQSTFNGVGNKNYNNSLFYSSQVSCVGGINSSIILNSNLSGTTDAATNNYANNSFSYKDTILANGNNSGIERVTSFRSNLNPGLNFRIVDSTFIGLNNTINATTQDVNNVHVFGTNNIFTNVSNMFIFGSFRNDAETGDIVQIATGDGLPGLFTKYNSLKIKNNDRSVFVKKLGIETQSQGVAAGFTISVVLRGYIKLSCVAPVTSDAVTAITPGTNTGETLILENASSDTITLIHDAGIKLNGSANVVLTRFSTISFIWNGVFWLETARSIV